MIYGVFFNFLGSFLKKTYVHLVRAKYLLYLYRNNHHMSISNILSVSNFRSNIYNAIKEVISKSMALKITSKGGNVIIIPEEEYNSMKETFHLMKSPVNSLRLQAGIDSLNRGKAISKTIEELENLTD